MCRTYCVCAVGLRFRRFPVKYFKPRASNSKTPNSQLQSNLLSVSVSVFGSLILTPILILVLFCSVAAFGSVCFGLNILEILVSILGFGGWGPHRALGS